MTNCARGLKTAGFCAWKIPAARTASAAIWLCFGRVGATTAVSESTPMSGEVVGWVIRFAVLAALQFVLPVATPWQYWVVEVLHVSPPPPDEESPLRKPWRYAASPIRSLLVHWLPQKTRYAAGAVCTAPPRYDNNGDVPPPPVGLPFPVIVCTTSGPPGPGAHGGEPGGAGDAHAVPATAPRRTTAPTRPPMTYLPCVRTLPPSRQDHSTR